MMENTAEELKLSLSLDKIAAEMSAKLDAERPPWEPRDHTQNNWCSEVGHPCLKNLVHCRVDWGKAEGIDLRGRWRVEEGTVKEWHIKKWLGDIGYELSETQKRYSTDDPGMEKYKHLHLSGKIDGVCPIKKKLPPPFDQIKEIRAEIKTVNPTFWEITKTIEDLKTNSKWWLKKIPSQLNCYLVMAGDPGGFLFIATFGKPLRILPMLVDMELWKYDSRRMIKINAHVKRGSYPPPIPFNPSVCGMCDFSHLCNPLKPANVTEIPEIDEIVLREYLEQREQARIFKKMHKELIGDKDNPGKYYGQNGFVGDIEVSTTISPRKKCVGMPKKLKEPYMEDYDLTQTKIDWICK